MLFTIIIVIILAVILSIKIIDSLGSLLCR